MVSLNKVILSAEIVFTGDNESISTLADYSSMQKKMCFSHHDT